MLLGSGKKPTYVRWNLLIHRLMTRAGVIKALLLLGLILTAPARARADEVREAKIFTAAVYYIGSFTRWKESKPPSSSFRLCAVATDTEIDALEQHFREKKLSSRRVNIESLKNFTDAAVLQCEMIYFGKDQEIPQQLVKELSERGVLTVGRTASFLRHGGMVEIRQEDNRLTIAMSGDALKRSPVSFSSELLSIAKIE